MMVLVVNAGSTSLKLSIVDEAGTSRQVDSLDDEGENVDAVAHRIVHGGTRFREPVLIDADVIAALEALAELAPLHNRRGAEGITEAMTAFPHIPHVAVFDTAFHGTIPAEAFSYALPARWRNDWDIL